MVKKVLEGSHAVAEAVKLCRPDVIAAYPITPQTHIIERLSEFHADGELGNCQFIRVESEHSAMSVCLGASLVGARAYSASTSQGLALMYEVLFNVAGLRQPIVMTTANRALSAPINIWNDWQDAISARDSGWIQLYAENAQEAVDYTIQAFKIAESHDILLPAMVCIDGFIITHTYEVVDIPEQEEVDEFLPKKVPYLPLDPENPIAYGMIGTPDVYEETRYLIQETMERAKKKIVEVAQEFEKKFGRPQGGLIDTYRLEDAEVAIISMGAILQTMREVVDKLREEGVPVGLIKVKSYRPFPRDEIREAVKGLKAVAVIDRDISLGFEGALFTDVKASLYGSDERPLVKGYIAALGGRDFPESTVRKIVNDIMKVAREGKIDKEVEWPDLRREIL